MKKVIQPNGSVLHIQEKGDPAPPGAGRPPGSVSFKTIANKILDGLTTIEDEQGNELPMTRREAIVLGVIQDALKGDDPNIRLKAAFGLWDKLDPKEAADINIRNISNGGEMDAARFAALKALAEPEKNAD